MGDRSGITHCGSPARPAPWSQTTSIFRVRFKRPLERCSAGRHVASDINSLMNPSDKPLFWLAGEVKSPPFSAEARLEAGFLLRRLQMGEILSLPHSRPMPTIGRGCHELWIVDAEATWRLVYAIDRDAIVILEVFSKKTRATPNRVLTVCRERLRAYRSAREQGGTDG